MSNLREEIEKELYKIAQRNCCDIDSATYEDLARLVIYFYDKGYVDGVSDISYPILTTSKMKKR